MKLSVFPKPKPLPTKEEKDKEARLTSKPFLPEVRDFETEEELVDLVCDYAWSPSLFSGYRNQGNFIQTDLMVLDIDEGMTIDEAYEIVEDMKITCLCLPSTSHTEEHHRFRLIFPTSKTITDTDTFKSTMTKLAERFPADKACIGDTARFYFGSTDNDGFFYDYDLLEPSTRKLRKASERGYDRRDVVEVGQNIEELTEHLYGEKRKKIPESISYFLENAPDNLSGEWYNASNSFLFTCGLQGLDYDRITEVFYKLYIHEVTDKVKKMVDKIVNEGYDEREEEPDKEVE